MTLRERRQAAGLTQVELAKKLRVHQTAVSLWEKGIHRPYKKTLLRMAKLYGCTVEEIAQDVASTDAPQNA